MKIICYLKYFLMFSVLFQQRGHTQCPEYGSVTLTSQEAVNSFQTDYPGCSRLPGNLTIKGNDITNLDVLSVLDRKYEGARLKKPE